MEKEPIGAILKQSTPPEKPKPLELIVKKEGAPSFSFYVRILIGAAIIVIGHYLILKYVI